MRIFSRAHVSLAAPSYVLEGRVGIMASRQFKVALELGLGFEFDFDFPKFPTLNCRRTGLNWASSGNFMLFTQTQIL